VVGKVETFDVPSVTVVTFESMKVVFKLTVGVVVSTCSKVVVTCALSDMIVVVVVVYPSLLVESKQVVHNINNLM
jgi:hypothetical protein